MWWWHHWVSEPPQLQPPCPWHDWHPRSRCQLLLPPRAPAWTPLLVCRIWSPFYDDLSQNQVFSEHLLLTAPPPISRRRHKLKLLPPLITSSSLLLKTFCTSSACKKRINAKPRAFPSLVGICTSITLPEREKTWRSSSMSDVPLIPATNIENKRSTHFASNNSLSTTISSLFLSLLYFFPDVHIFIIKIFMCTIKLTYRLKLINAIIDFIINSNTLFVI